jgi:poly(A) polymerase
MRLRAEIGELDMVLSDWWEAFSLANDDLRNDMVDEVKLEQQQQRAKSTRAPRTPRVHSVPSRANSDAAPQAAAPEAATDRSDLPPDAVLVDGFEAPRKRRRRRRPTGRGAGDAPAQDPQV